MPSAQTNKDNKNMDKKTITRKQQRQNVMKAIYQMSINQDCTIDELYFDNKKSRKEEINNQNIKQSKNIENINKLINDFANENINKDFEIEEVSENDGVILYEDIDYNTVETSDLEKYEDLEYFNTMTKFFANNKEEIDKQIEMVLFDKWKISRLSKIDLAILRTAISDISGMNTPYKVAVNEALNLAKDYSDEKSSKFINGVLKEYIKQFVETEEK